MTPAKEKAKELVYKYNFLKEIFIPSIHEQKQCALIAVDEIMQHAENSYYNEDIINGAKLYWQEVKQEIEML
jgi:hypothetical protein